jgi:hypothetical protein
MSKGEGKSLQEDGASAIEVADAPVLQDIDER